MLFRTKLSLQLTVATEAHYKGPDHWQRATLSIARKRTVVRRTILTSHSHHQPPVKPIPPYLVTTKPTTARHFETTQLSAVLRGGGDIHDRAKAVFPAVVADGVTTDVTHVIEQKSGQQCVRLSPDADL